MPPMKAYPCEADTQQRGELKEEAPCQKLPLERSDWKSAEMPLS